MARLISYPILSTVASGDLLPITDISDTVKPLKNVTAGTLSTFFNENGVWAPVTGGINYSGGNVGIGTVSPSQKLEVNGDAKINGLTVGKGPGSLSQNVVLGIQALASNTTGNRNLAIGPEALEDNTTGTNNVAIGWVALQKNQTSSNNIAVGAGAIGLTQGGNNTAIGYAAGYGRVGGTNASGVGSVFVGKSTTSNGIGSVNEIVIGTDAISAGSNTAVLGNDNIVSTRLKGNVIVANGSVGIGTTSPGSKLEVDSGDIEIGGAGGGLILKSPDGTRYRITVANGGTLTVAAV